MITSLAPVAPAVLNGQLVTVDKPMRGLVKQLESPRPLIESLPGLFQQDQFARRFVSAFDDAFAPIMSTLDNLTAYFDPWLAPHDFLEWLGRWVGITLDETWPIERRRRMVAQAHDLYRMRGTLKGLRAHIEIFTGGTVEIVDTGGVASSPTAGASFPGSPNFAVLVRVQVDDPNTVSMPRLEALVKAAKPAHLTHKVQLTKRSEAKDGVEVNPG
jgi:phage tail-like protein